MKSLKAKFGILISLAVAFLVALGFSLGLFVANADRTVRITGSNIFITTGNAQVVAHKETTDGYTEYFTTFAFRSDSDAVNYRKNLAYSWYYADKVEDEDKGMSFGQPQSGFLNMETGFETFDFDKVIFTFESQQYSRTKDEKTTNYIIFTVADATAKTVYAYITDNLEEEAPETQQPLNAEHITVSFGEKTDGNYPVTVSDGMTDVTGVFENVGGTYAQYSSSSTTPVTPLSIKAQFSKEEGAGTKLAKVVLYSLNGQTFRYGSFTKVETPTADNLGTYYVKEGDKYERVPSTTTALEEGKDYYTYDASRDVTESGEECTLANGYINDDAAPVLCLKSGISYVREGRELSFDFETIDVLASAPGETVSYFMLTDAQSKITDFNAENYADETLFREVSDTDDQYMIPHANHYVPTDSAVEGTEFNDEFKATAAVKIVLKLTDTTSTGGISDYVLLEWYVNDNYLLNVNGNKYVAVATDESGAKFAYTNDEAKTSTLDEAWESKLEAYRTAVDAAAQDLKAGSKNNFYLPSVENLISDNATDYEDFTFAIYYKTDKDTGTSGQSVTGRKYNTLAIPLNGAGKYIFTVYATDSSSNDMYYYKDGKLEKFGMSDIWNMYNDDSEDNLKDYLPWFEFDVKVSEISIEDPGERDTAYVGTEYRGVSFDINGVSSEYETDYKLYRFQNDLYYGANGEALTYDKFMSDKETLFTEHREWFTNIPSTSDEVMKEGSEEYEEYKDYAWSNTSLTFVPQDANTFYLVKLTVTSSDNGQQKDVSYMGISAAPRVRNLVGEDTWLEDNMTSVILLCIAGASLIGIILLLVIKPKDKGDIDEAFNKEIKKSK